MVFSHYLVDFFFSTSDTSKTFHHHLGEPLLMLVLSQRKKSKSSPRRSTIFVLEATVKEDKEWRWLLNGMSWRSTRAASVSL
ncbi:hypothetical protein ISN45_Aa03g037150 [Arabidopsis thaliana x Arabidopsis arenosa]|uniref:Uncharacterized protein n=1 Tax=Arabidopsis thaliana x Arabidopsis arenosa TaxID=1240361 RepID=A0A8T2AZP0_9BRAS|nr:hypothetical protein ISN45_Aa03g037150 [Arabidopsis thaliana x Arabidopsis arenosa]